MHKGKSHGLFLARSRSRRRRSRRSLAVLMVPSVYFCCRWWSSCFDAAKTSSNSSRVSLTLVLWGRWAGWKALFEGVVKGNVAGVTMNGLLWWGWGLVIDGEKDDRERTEAWRQCRVGLKRIKVDFNMLGWEKEIKGERKDVKRSFKIYIAHSGVEHSRTSCVSPSNGDGTKRRSVPWDGQVTWFMEVRISANGQ